MKKYEKVSWLKIAWDCSRLYKKLSVQEREELVKILDNNDDVEMEFFLRHHWKLICKNH